MNLKTHSYIILYTYNIPAVVVQQLIVLAWVIHYDDEC